jgi:hypothetical protein
MLSDKKNKRKGEASFRTTSRSKKARTHAFLKVIRERSFPLSFFVHIKINEIRNTSYITENQHIFSYKTNYIILQPQTKSADQFKNLFNH